MKNTFFSILLASCCIVSSCNAYGNELDDANVAYNSDDPTNFNFAKAFGLFQKLANEGNVKAQYQLGVFYSDGCVGIDKTICVQDYGLAAKWFKAAADQGDAQSQEELGGLYRLGLGVRKSCEEAIRLTTLAARQGLARANYELGFFYGQGVCFNKNPQLAYMWFNIAELNGDSVASSARKGISEQLSRSQIEEALELSTKCIRSQYSKCE